MTTDLSNLLSGTIGAALGGVIGAVASVGGVFAQARTASKQATTHRNADTLRFLLAMHAEITALWAAYYRQTGTALIKHSNNLPFEYIFPVSDNVICIYKTENGKIGNLKDAKLAQKIVKFYTSAFGMISTFQYNNLMVERLSVLRDRMIHNSGSNAYAEWNMHANAMSDYAMEMKERHRELEALVEDILPSIMFAAEQLRAAVH